MKQTDQVSSNGYDDDDENGDDDDNDDDDDDDNDDNKDDENEPFNDAKTVNRSMSPTVTCKTSLPSSGLLSLRIL